MYSSEWSEAELAHLAKANVNDPTTWPARSVRDLENLLGERPSAGRSSTMWNWKRPTGSPQTWWRRAWR
jgi:hypothetical protein